MRFGARSLFRIALPFSADQRGCQSHGAGARGLGAGAPGGASLLRSHRAGAVASLKADAVPGTSCPIFAGGVGNSGAGAEAKRARGAAATALARPV
jgi:hypothetical protein